MKKVGSVLIIVGVLFAAARGGIRLFAYYEYQEIYSYWDLSEKASTIELKSEYMDEFVRRMNDAQLNGLNSRLFFFTPDKDFDKNFSALKSLQQRLNEIEEMDVSSFEYQSAMQQITAQEQGEAREMLDVLESCWYKKQHYTIYNGWIVTSFVLLQFILIGSGIIMILE